MKSRLLMGFAVALLAALPTLAHHSFGAEYDGNKPVTLTGVVSSDIEREDVVKAVERVLDVEAIVDELEVSCATRERTPDRRSLEPSL